MANECIPLYELGYDLTALAGAAITGKTFVKVSSALSPGSPAARTDFTSVGVVTATAGVKTLGVAAYDAASGARVAVIGGPGTVVPVTCRAAVTAGTDVESNASGQAITRTTGTPVGHALTTTAGAGQDLFVKLY